MSSELRRKTAGILMTVAVVLVSADLLVFALGSHIHWWPRRLQLVSAPLLLVGFALHPIFFREYLTRETAETFAPPNE